MGDLQILHCDARGLKRDPLEDRSLFVGRMVDVDEEEEEDEPALLVTREPEAVRLRCVYAEGEMEASEDGARPVRKLLHSQRDQAQQVT